MNRRLTQYYHNFSNLSLDVVAGVFSCMLPLPRFFQTTPGYAWYAGLPLAAWFIYLTDHLIDLYTHPEIETTRHNYTRRHRSRIYIALLVIGTLLVVLVVVNSSHELIKAGTITAGACLIYFLLLIIRFRNVSRLKVNKEIWVALIYSGGIFSLFQFGSTPWYDRILPFFLFGCITYQSLIMNSLTSINEDRKNRMPGIVTRFGGNFVTTLWYLFGSCLLVLLIIAMITGNDHETYLFHMYTLMVMINLLLFRFTPNGIGGFTFREISEWVFWLPGLLWLFEGWL